MKSSTRIQRITVGVLALILLVPLMTLVVPIPATSIEGMPTSVTAPRWSIRSVAAGKYQAQWSNWALKNHPLWSWSIKTTNELVYRLTGEISLDYGTSIQGGNDGYLWQPMYLRAFNRSAEPSEKDFNRAYKRLRRLQDALAAHGVPLIAVMNPNLVMLYPELLPEKYKAIRAAQGGHELAQRMIAKHKATVVDSFHYLRQIQPLFPVRFFEPTGSHWNEVGSCLAVQQVGNVLAKAWNEKLPDPRCGDIVMEYPPRPHEIDLVKIANLLSPEALYRPAAYNREIPKASLTKPRKILLVGTSFLFGLEKQLLRREIASSTTLLFYHRQIRRDGKGAFRPLRSQLTKEMVLSYDAIIVDTNVSNPIGFGYGFLDTLAKHFPPQAKPKAAKVKKVKG